MILAVIRNLVPRTDYCVLALGFENELKSVGGDTGFRKYCINIPIATFNMD
jgi:hypothetical protein